VGLLSGCGRNQDPTATPSATSAITNATNVGHGTEDCRTTGSACDHRFGGDGLGGGGVRFDTGLIVAFTSGYGSHLSSAQSPDCYLDSIGRSDEVMYFVT
jgi:hypothetical protein